MSPELELAIRDWVDSFEARPAGSSKPIRLSSGSVTVHRAKDFGSEWLWFITCDRLSHPEQGVWAWTGVASKVGPGRWSAYGIEGRGGHPLLKGVPWVNLGGQFLEDGFRAGGWVEDAGRQIRIVRLIDPAGVVLDDHVENQVALFRSYLPVTLPLMVQLIDNRGAIAGTHQFP